MTLFWLSAYLAVGALIAGGVYLLLDRLLAQDTHNERLTAGLQEIERSAGMLPGGMVTGLVAITLAWPALVAKIIIAWGNRRR